MSRPSFVLRSSEDIRFVDKDGKETEVSLVELLILVEQAALIARLACPVPRPRK